MLPGTMHHVNMAQATGLCQSRRGPALVRCTPKFRAGAALPERGPGGGRASSADSAPALVSTPPWPVVGLLAPALYSLSSPQPCSFVCELLMPPPLPCLAAAVTEGRRGGGAASAAAPLATEGSLHWACLAAWPHVQPAVSVMGCLPTLSQPASGAGAGHPLGEGAAGRGPRARCGDWRLAQSRACAGCGALAPT